MILLAECKHNVRLTLSSRSKLFDHHAFFPSVHDAVLFGRKLLENRELIDKAIQNLNEQQQNLNELTLNGDEETKKKDDELELEFELKQQQRQHRQGMTISEEVEDDEV